jgi:hypothetical protein
VRFWLKMHPLKKKKNNIDFLENCHFGQKSQNM